MASKLTVDRNFIDDNITTVSSTGLRVSYTFSSAVVSGGGKSLKIISFIDADMPWVANQGTVTLTGVNNVNMPSVSTLVWSFSGSGLDLITAGPSMTFPASGGSFKLTFTYDRYWNKVELPEFTKYSYGVSMSPLPTSANFAATSNAMTIDYTPSAGNTSVPSLSYCNGFGVDPIYVAMGVRNLFWFSGVDSGGNPVTTGGFNLNLSCVPVGFASTPCYGYRDLQNGTAICFWFPSLNGSYDLGVALGATQLTTFPLTLTV